MKFGVNTFVWVSPCTTEAMRDLAPKVKAMGFDILELAVENPDLIDVEAVKAILNENQLEAIVCGAFGPNRNLGSSDQAIRRAGKSIFHFHACENDRGLPGTGQVRWNEISKALKDVNYQGPVVIESFTNQVKEIARAVCIWREIAPSQDAIAANGLGFLKSLFA